MLQSPFSTVYVQAPSGTIFKTDQKRGGTAGGHPSPRLRPEHADHVKPMTTDIKHRIKRNNFASKTVETTNTRDSTRIVGSSGYSPKNTEHQLLNIEIN